LGQDGVDDGPVRRALALSLAGADAEKWDAIVEKFGLVADRFADRALKNKRRKGGSMLYVSRGLAGGQTILDPSTLNLTGWLRGSYSGSPWGGTASAGVSGDGVHDLVTDVNAPTAGAAVNGFTPASFAAASSQAFVGDQNWDQYLTAGAGSIAILFKAASANVDAGAGSRINNPGLLVQDTGSTTFGLNYSDAGVTFEIFDASVTWRELTAAASTGAWHLAQAKWNGTNMFLRVDGGAWGSLSCTGPTTTALVMPVGRTFDGATFYNGDMLEVITSTQVLSDATFDGLRDYVNSRYGVSV
jgi:hypothetical protein